MQSKTRERILYLARRPWRLLALALLLAGLFAVGRLFVLLALAGLGIAAACRGRDARSATWVRALAVLVLALLALHVAAYREVDGARSFARANEPIDVARVPDGLYVGTGLGANGPVRARVAVHGGKLAWAAVLSSRDPIYAFDAVLPKLVGRTTSALPETAGFLFRRDQSLRGLQQAIDDALLPAVGGYRPLSPVARASFFLTENRVGKLALNALAILFIVVLAFDYALQPVLAEGTGQSLNCYNCQACVGVCPIKNVEGVPFPITMVLEARLGRYENVERLAGYCVACGRCAAKCPVGNSGPSIGSAAIVRRRRQAKAAGERTR